MQFIKKKIDTIFCKEIIVEVYRTFYRQGGGCYSHNICTKCTQQHFLKVFKHTTPEHCQDTQKKTTRFLFFLKPTSPNCRV
jgi:hypothetical protein